MWTEGDKIQINPSKEDETLENFLKYREEILEDHPNDNAQLLTSVRFPENVVGKARKGVFCTPSSSAGLIVKHSDEIEHVASTMAHEMGHNFGMEHDADHCKCPDKFCIMFASSVSFQTTRWSSCSIDYLTHSFGRGLNYCLK